MISENKLYRGKIMLNCRLCTCVDVTSRTTDVRTYIYVCEKELGHMSTIFILGYRASGAERPAYFDM